MKKILFLIFILLILIATVSFYGYKMIFLGGFNEQLANNSFFDIDTGISEIQAFGISDELVSEIENDSMIATTTATSSINSDQVISELQKVQNQNTDNLKVDTTNI